MRHGHRARKDRPDSDADRFAQRLPLLDALGYDIWNPAELCPEYGADFATKKAGQKEKVDLAILFDNTPRVFIECKAVDVVLDDHAGQLARYFNATPAVSLGILTNGVEYRFYTDTDQPNLMDGRPFHIYRIDAIDQGLEILTRFARNNVTPSSIREYATELNYTTKMVRFLRDQLDLREREPDEQLTRWVLASEGMYEGDENSWRRSQVPTSVEERPTTCASGHRAAQRRRNG